MLPHVSHARRATFLPAAALLLVSLAQTSPALAKPSGFLIENPSVRVDLAFPGADVCVLRPIAERVAADCAGLDADFAEKALDPSATAAVVMREGPASEPKTWIVAAMAQPRVGGAHMTIEEVELLAKGVVAAVAKSSGGTTTARGLAEGTTHTLGFAGGGQALRQRMETAASADGKEPATHTASATLVGRDNLTTLVVIPIAPAQLDADDLLTRVLSRVTVTPPPGPVRWESDAYWERYQMAVAGLPVAARLVLPAVRVVAGVVW